MMRPFLLALPFALLACTGSTPDTDTGTVADTDTDSDTDTDTDTGEEDCEPDDDNDGWCPPEDCDDSTIWVNPSWAENPDDGIDNNCDGRVDEVFSQVFVLEWDLALEETSLVKVDPLGILRGRFGSGELAMPQTATLDHDLRSFVAWDTNNLTLWRFDQNGAITAIGAIDPEFEWPNSEGEPDPPPIFGDLVAHPDGYYLLAAGDRLLRFNTDSSWSTVAEWPCVDEDAHDMCATAIGADPVNGTVMLFGYFGGTATWTADGGFELLEASNPEEPGPQFLQTQFKPFDSWFSLALYYDEELGAANYGMFRYNRADKKQVLVGAWSDANFQPNSFSIEEISGDFYFAVNSPRGGRGAYHNQIWRMSAQGQTSAILYATEPERDTNYFVAAAVHYDHK